MKQAVLAILVCALVAPHALAQARDEARPRDIQRLDEDLANLDEELKLLEPGDPKTEGFRQRAEEIREETIFLKVKARKHERAGGEGLGISSDEIGELRRRITDLRDDIEGSFGRAATKSERRIDQGVRILVRLDEAISSKTARREDRIEASVFRPVMLGNDIAIPAGTRVRAVVRDVEPAQRPNKAGKLELDFDSLYLDSGRLEMRTRVVSIGDDSGRNKTVEKAGIGAAVGGVLGAILGGTEGAIIGAVVGGGGAVAGTKGEEVKLPAGTVVAIAVEQAIVLPPQLER
jgi:hypothetical protein